MKPKATKTTQHTRIKTAAGSAPHVLTECVVEHNKVITNLVSKLNALQIPDFGSGLYHGDNISCVFNNADTIIASTIADRIINKFEEPDRNTERQLWRECSDQWINFEDEHIRKYEFSLLDQSTRATVYKSRALIDKWLFNPPPGHKSFWEFVNNYEINLGPGESFDSSKGDVSTFSKLNNLNNWTVTDDAALSASYLIAVNNGFRRCLDKFFRRKRLERKLAFRKTGVKSKVNHPVNCKKSSKLGVLCYAHRVLNEFFYEYPIDHPKCRVKRGSKGTSVYKNRKKRRFINKECLLNIILQKIAGSAIRSCLKQIGIDLDKGQSTHKRMISNPNCSTIDESNASDSVVLSTLYEMIGNRRLNNIIDLTRSPFCLLETFMDVKSSSTIWHPIKKLSSMGNGYTFEFLTLVLASICRQFDDKASVYGDDIVCTNESVHPIVSAISSVGFIVNTKKSFIALPFRESCGAFYLDGRGYITCYDIKWATELQEVILTYNKLGRILRWNNGWKHPLRNLIQKAYEEIGAVIPRNYVGPVSSFKDVPLWAEFENYGTATRNNKVCNLLYKRHSDLLTSLGSKYQWDLKDKKRPYVIINMRDKKMPLRLNIVENVRSNALLMTYVLTSRRLPMYYRRDEDARYRNVTCIVTPDGSAIRVGTARRIVADDVC